MNIKYESLYMDGFYGTRQDMLILKLQHGKWLQL